MKIQVPVVIQDQLVAAGKGVPETEEIEIEETFFLDGPVSERVAVLDFDEDGALTPGSKFKRPDGDTPGFYAGAGDDLRSDPAIQVNVFGAVHQTISLFEEKDALGRRVRWAFDAPQLLVVPRAGKWANAYYERDSHSLQFFSFASARPGYEGREVLTSLSHDIVAHETAHAVLDAIAPDLYNAISPQSLALHEALADLAALLTAFRSEKLCDKVLSDTGGSIDRATAFSDIAEEFGVQRAAAGPLRPLRDLLNEERLPDSGGRRLSPHALSEVLSGALYGVMVRMHENRKKHYLERGRPPEDAARFALSVAGQHFKRMILRALDYLPPGEISFADYGRAIVAADKASHPDWGRERGWIATDFRRRNIVKHRADLLDTDPSATRRRSLEKTLAGMDLETLVESDWAAYDFAARHRKLLRIPEEIPIRVRPRLDVTKEYRAPGGRTRDVRECIFKVSWDAEEENPSARGLPPKRQITLGTMLAIDWETRTVRALLTSDTSAQQRKDRDGTLLHLQRQGRLSVGSQAIGPDGKPVRSATIGEVSGDLLRIRKSARMLHIDPLEVEGVG